MEDREFTVRVEGTHGYCVATIEAGSLEAAYDAALHRDYDNEEWFNFEICLDPRYIQVGDDENFEESTSKEWYSEDVLVTANAKKLYEALTYSTVRLLSIVEFSGSTLDSDLRDILVATISDNEELLKQCRGD